MLPVCGRIGSPQTSVQRWVEINFPGNPQRRDFGQKTVFPEAGGPPSNQGIRGISNSGSHYGTKTKFLCHTIALIVRDNIFSSKEIKDE